MTTYYPHKVAVMVSAKVEWDALKTTVDLIPLPDSPYGEVGTAEVSLTPDKTEEVILYHGGWGKVDAAASTQYVIHQASPELLVTLGTCGGFAGHIQVGETVLVNKTIIYDIVERMFDTQEAIDHYSTTLDLSWVNPPLPLLVQQALLISADQDIDPQKVSQLIAQYQTIAADWESGAIAHIAQRHRIRCLILKSVSDLVGDQGGEAYGGGKLFEVRTQSIMEGLWASIPGWIQIHFQEPPQH